MNEGFRNFNIKKRVVMKDLSHRGLRSIQKIKRNWF